ncbi:MAG: superoxide dismutase family protein [Bdellovibrionales bacterium]|nr:superoxide dismutase family protein [Bdellovibrionales bacterium]
MIQKTGIVLISGLLLTGCHILHKKCPCKKKELSAYAEIKSISDSSAQGWIQFDWAGKRQVKVTAEVTGLKPNEKVGFHIHEFGDCGNQGLNAGGHFNPKGYKHGGPSDKKRHCGDLGNLVADAEGKAVYEQVVHGKPYKFFGRSVVIHGQADDLKTQPTGDAGDRMACGVVGAISKPVSVPAPDSAEVKPEGTPEVIEASQKEEPTSNSPKVIPAVASSPEKTEVKPKQEAVPVKKGKKEPVVPVAVTKPAGAAVKKENAKAEVPKKASTPTPVSSEVKKK